MQTKCQVCWGSKSSGGPRPLHISTYTYYRRSWGQGPWSLSIVLMGRQVVIAIYMSKTYFYVDIVLAVLYHVDVRSVDGLFMVLYPSRPISGRAEQLWGNNKKWANVRQWRSHQMHWYNEICPFAFKQLNEYNGLSVTCGSRQSRWVGITHNEGAQLAIKYWTCLLPLKTIVIQNGKQEGVSIKSISGVPHLVAEWGAHLYFSQDNSTISPECLVLWCIY